MQQLTVVLVDDEEEFVSTLAERLELRGIRAMATTDGEQGLEAITRLRPRVAVVDVKMPGIDGLRLLRRIKELNPGTQVRSSSLDTPRPRTVSGGWSLGPSTT